MISTQKHKVILTAKYIVNTKYNETRHVSKGCCMVKLKQVTTRWKDKRKVGRTTEALSLTIWQNYVIKEKQL